MVLLLVADMVGCPFTELEETTCDFSVHVAFFWVVSIESVSRKIRCCCTSWRTRTNMTDRQFEPCMTDQQAAFLFFVQEVMGNSNACDGPTFTAWTFELVWNDWVSSCSFWSFTRWEHEGQPKAWASVHIVIDWLYARSGHWLSLHPLRHWHLYVFAGLDGRLRWWCLFSMTSSQWRAWIKVWAGFFNHAVIDHWVCVRACGCLWVVSGATCNELLAWALEFSCHSWFVTLCTVQVNNDRSIDIFNHSGQQLSKGIDSKSVFCWLWVLVKLRTYHSIKNECSMCHDPYTHILSCSHVGQWGRGNGSSTDVRVSAFIAFQLTVWSMSFKLQCFSQPSWHVSDCPILSVSLARLLSGHLVFEAHGRGSQVNVSVKLVGKWFNWIINHFRKPNCETCSQRQWHENQLCMSICSCQGIQVLVNSSIAQSRHANQASSAAKLGRPAAWERRRVCGAGGSQCHATEKWGGTGFWSADDL